MAAHPACTAGRSDCSLCSWLRSSAPPPGRLGWPYGADAEEAPGPEGRESALAARGRGRRLEGEGKTRVHCDPGLHQRDPTGRRCAAVDRGPRGDAWVLELASEK